MKSLEQFLKDYLGQSKGYPTDDQYKGECLSIVKLYIKECFGITPPSSGSGSAYGYWINFPNPLGEKFEKVGNTDTLIPQKGWIVIWKPWSTNQYGHIAIIKDGNLNTFNSYDQNWGTRIFKEINHNYDNVIGFLKPKESIISEMTDVISELIKANGLVEGDIRWLIDLKTNQTVPNLEKKVNELESSIKDLGEQINIINAKLGENEKDLVSCQKELKIANQTISNISAELETANGEKSQYKKWYEAKCDELKKIDKMTAYQHIIYGIKLLINKKQ